MKSLEQTRADLHAGVTAVTALLPTEPPRKEVVLEDTDVVCTDDADGPRQAVYGVEFEFGEGVDTKSLGDRLVADLVRQGWTIRNDYSTEARGDVILDRPTAEDGEIDFLQIFMRPAWGVAGPTIELATAGPCVQPDDGERK